MLTIVFCGVVLQPVMVLALVGCKRVFKVVFNTEFVPFGPAPQAHECLLHPGYVHSLLW